jgi:hypothetical protein
MNSSTMKPRPPGDRLRGKIVAEERSSLMFEGFVASLLSAFSGHRTATDGELPFSRAELFILLTLDLLSAFIWACRLDYRSRLNHSDGRDRVVLGHSGNSHLLNRRLPFGPRVHGPNNSRHVVALLPTSHRTRTIHLIAAAIL